MDGSEEGASNSAPSVRRQDEEISDLPEVGEPQRSRKLGCDRESNELPIVFGDEGAEAAPTETLGQLIASHQGTLEHFAGDGVMVFFNDPVPLETHELEAIKLALVAQERIGQLAQVWHKRGIQLGLGIGIEAGYATLGRIGYEGRYDYGALGPVTNLASRLSSFAQSGQTLIGQRVHAAVEELAETVPIGDLELKGFGRPIPAYEVRALRDLT